MIERGAVQIGGLKMREIAIGATLACVIVFGGFVYTLYNLTQVGGRAVAVGLMTTAEAVTLVAVPVRSRKGDRLDCPCDHEGPPPMNKFEREVAERLGRQ